MLGGAALTRRYVEEDCVTAYGAGRVAYARDAFDGLDADGQGGRAAAFDDHLRGAQGRARAAKPSNRARKLGRAAAARRRSRPVDVEEIKLRRAELARGLAVPAPPFWGARIIARVPVQALVPYLNERMLYQFHWGYRKDGRTLDEFMDWAQHGAAADARTHARRASISEDILRPQAAYGYWPCAAEGNDVILFGEDGQRELARFAFPRQAKRGRPLHRRFLPRRRATASAT